MKRRIILFSMLLLALVACKHDHEEHDAPEMNKEKTQFTVYSEDFELFAEADQFVAGQASNVLAHFTHLPEFKALESGEITMRLLVNGIEAVEMLEAPVRKGIYSFNCLPETAGIGTLIFNIKTEDGNFEITIPEVEVYKSHEEADNSTGHATSEGNGTVFTKEQSWKIDFATELPESEIFGQAIKTAAQVQSGQGDEILVSAKTSGIVVFPVEKVLEGKSVAKAQVLFTISGSGLADNNSAVKFQEAQNKYEEAKLNYARKQELAKNKIVSEKELLNSKYQYKNAKLTYENLNKNFSASGQKVTSSMNGFISQVFVQNGQFVETGQTLISISQNRTLVLQTEVQQKYAPILGTIYSANLRTLHNNKTYTLEELNGKLLSYGRSTNSDNFLIPVNLQIDNTAGIMPGTFVELVLKTRGNSESLTLPNEAILEEQGTYFVYVQLTPELFQRREIKIGANDGLRTEIKEGLAAEDRIVSKGAVFIKLAQTTGSIDAHSGHVH